MLSGFLSCFLAQPHFEETRISTTEPFFQLMTAIVDTTRKEPEKVDIRYAPRERKLSLPFGRLVSNEQS